MKLHGRDPREASHPGPVWEVPDFSSGARWGAWGPVSPRELPRGIFRLRNYRKTQKGTMI